MRGGLPGVVLAATAGLATLVAGCHCAGNTSLSQTGNIGPRGNHQLNCNCAVNITGICQYGGAPPTINVPLQLCLPPDLNSAVGGDSDASDSQYASDVTSYCQNRVATILDKLVPFLDSQACGQSMDCIQSISCAPQAGPDGLDTVGNPSCDGTCASVPCVLGTIPEGGPPADAGPDSPNCDPGKVLPSGSATANPQFCKCTQASGCNGTTEEFCQVPPGNVDPPVLVSGFMTQRLSGPNLVRLDNNASTVAVHIHFTGGLGESHDDTEVTGIGGAVNLYGHPCPGSSCDLLMDMNLHPADVTFHFSAVVCGALCVEDIDVTASQISVIGGMGHLPVHVMPDGTGTIPAGTLILHAESIVSGIPNQSTVREIYDAPNSTQISFQIDWAHKTFTLPNVPFTLEGGDGDANMTLTGTIADQPPQANAGADQVLECTSPAGATVTLDGTASSDPDNDLFGYEWWKGTAFDPSAVLGAGKTFSLTQAIGPNTEYQLSVLDSFLAISAASTHVRVQDTTAPTLDLSVDPTCLWAPNHSLVLYEIGAGLNAVAKDTCDATPSVKILDVTSNQSPTGGGSGNTGPDVFYDDTAFCVREERDGTVPSPRQYTVTVQASDSSGNQTTKSVVITVPHSSGGGSKCPLVDSTRVVADGDPRCGTAH